MKITDKMRLDWLQDANKGYFDFMPPERHYNKMYKRIRHAIDAAIIAEKDSDVKMGNERY